MAKTPDQILLVDDSLTVRMDLTEALEAAQLRVTACTTVAEARAALEVQRFGLVILDVVLPDGDGVDLLEEIRETPSLNGVAVILLSDESQVRDRIRGLMTGADEYIGKPYDARYVVASARELLRRGRQDDKASHDTILVIDDSRTFCEQMREALEEASYRVLTAGTGEDGLRLAAHERPAGIIVDRTLPGIDGVAVLRGIRLDAALRHIPCLLLSASEEKTAEVQALDAGADAFVRKDENIAIILARLSAVLRNRRNAPGGKTLKASLQGPKRILIIDGDDAYLRRVSGNLRDEGYEVVQARSGEEGFDLLSAQSVDCILLDLDMPGIGSQEACRRIKNVSFSSDTPIIITVAQEDRDAIIRCLAAGADDYIGKSGEFAVLRARVVAQIRRKQIEDENRLFREQLDLKEIEAAQARVSRELGAVQERLIERSRVEVALWELQFGLAQETRLASAGMVATMLSSVVHPVLQDLRNCLAHASRAAQAIDAPQIGHLAELLHKADAHAGQVTAAFEAFQAAILKSTADRSREQLNEIIQSITSPMARVWSAELDLALSLASDLPAAFVNKAQIQQVLAILTRRALESMRSSKRQQLTVVTKIGTPGILQVVMSDTGQGAAASGRDDLFAPHRELFKTNDDWDIGVCRYIVEAHGGRIWSAGNPDFGMTVTLELPLGAHPTP